MANAPPLGEPEPSEPAGLRALVDRSRERLAADQARVSKLIEKYEDKVVVGTALRTYERDREAAGTLVGCALAFRLFLFVVPLALTIVGLLGFLARWIDPDDINQAMGLTGAMAEQVNAALTEPWSTHLIATLVGLGGMMWAGRALTKVMSSASCLAWRLPVTAKASLRVIGAVVGLVAGMVLSWTIVDQLRRHVGLGAASLSFVAVIAIYAIVWMALSFVLPRATPDPGALLPGAVVVGGLLAVIQAGTQLLLADKVGRLSELYGAMAITFVTLGSYFFLGRAMVLGMTLDAVIFERYGSITQLVFALPVVRLLPRKSAWIRRVFDLTQ